MQINKFFIKYNSKNYGSNKQVDSMAETKINSEFISSLLNKIKDSSSPSEANKLLFDAVDSGDMASSDGVLFKSGEYVVQNMFKDFGSAYVQNMRKLGSLGLSIIPEYITTIEKDQDLYLFTKISGTKNGELIPFQQAREKVSKENLIKAYKELQQITKMGIVDNSVLNGVSWFVTPDDGKIVLPDWSRVRPLQPNEGKEVMEQYYSILFNK